MQVFDDQIREQYRSEEIRRVVTAAYSACHVFLLIYTLTCMKSSTSKTVRIIEKTARIVRVQQNNQLAGFDLREGF